MFCFADDNISETEQKINLIKKMDPSQPSQILLRQSTILKKTVSNSTSSANVDPTQQITDTFTKIHDTIENLDSKVQALLDKHEIEFLFAWQNHIKKIKNELKEIKDRSDEKEKLMNSNERMVAMEKQMALFRDESLRLYEEVEERKNELEVLRRRLKEQDLQLQVLRQQNKQLIKGAKMAQAKLIMQHQKLIQLQKQLSQLKQFQDSSQRISTLNMITVDNKNFTSKNLSIIHNRTLGFGDQNYNLSAIKSTEKTGLNFEKKTGTMTVKDNVGGDSFAISKLKQHKLNRLSVTNKWQTNGFDDSKQQIPEEQNSRKKKMSLQMNHTSSKTHYHNFMMIEPSVYQNQLKNWFLECIKSIKKEISSRKSGFTSPAVDILKVQSLEEFKTIDKLRLLEMFLENEKLLVYMYQKVFPDRLKEIEAWLNQSAGERKQQSNGHQGNSQQQGRSKANKTISYRNRQKSDHVKLSEVNQNSFDVELLQETGQKRSRNDSNIRVKSVSKASKSQPIRNRVIMRDGKLNLIF